MSISGTRPERTDKEITKSSQEARNIRRKTVQTHIEYGEITEVDYNTCRVKVRRRSTGKLIKIGKDNFNWLLTPITEIHMLYGPLVPGMKCRIHWEGPPGSEPGNNVAIDILGNKVDRLDKQDYKTNTVQVGFNAGKVM